MKISGYLILQKGQEKYRGVDRKIFEPAIFDSLVNKSIVEFKNIWELYPEGWRKELYKIFEENSLSVDEIQLVNDEKVAKSIANGIPKSEGEYEIIKSIIYSMDDNAFLVDSLPNSFIGFDIAYLGGDYYSAIKNGLLTNPSKALQRKYINYLNEVNLFDNRDILSIYLKEFKEAASRERLSHFYIYALSLV